MSTLRLTPRDLALLAHLGDHRFLDVHQVAVLHFPSEDAARRRLAVLLEHKLVHRLYMPVRPYDPTAVHVFALSGAGARALPAGRPGSTPPTVVSAAERRSGLFLDHTLRRNDVRIALERLGEQHPRFAFLGWKQRREDVEFRTTDRFLRRQRVVPDGVAYVRINGEVEVLALEIDLGTVRLPKMLARYRAYWQDFVDGGPRIRHGPVPYRVLTLTNAPERLASLRALAQRAPTRGRRGCRLFWFGLLDPDALGSPERLLAPFVTHAGYRPTDDLPKNEPLWPVLTPSDNTYDVATTLPPVWRESEVPPSSPRAAAP